MKKIFDIYNFREKGCIQRVIDGDTFRVVIEFENILIPLTVRLKGVDAPEKATYHGKLLKEYFITRLTNKPCIVTAVGSEAYGRVLGDIQVCNVNLAHWLLSIGAACKMDKKRVVRTEERTKEEFTIISSLFDTNSKINHIDASELVPATRTVEVKTVETVEIINEQQ